ncbi:hypothetical protein DJ017_16350 [Phenylobacterium soli]|uniref:Uncharacterized protein n=1 Tax=Phenylobacterium soli TaxID=2170551 RepID=A0A328ASR9_9CAUL|nr:hypothetical protein DJ017_16350 [Phenylobacterium soli]
MIKSRILAPEYLGRAAQSFAAAAASPLPQVRLRHQFAASVWLDLAVFEDQRTSHLQAVAVRLLAQAAARRSAQSPETSPCIT